jgi:hypothetical protein
MVMNEYSMNSGQYENNIQPASFTKEQLAAGVKVPPLVEQDLRLL